MRLFVGYFFATLGLLIAPLWSSAAHRTHAGHAGGTISVALAPVTWTNGGAQSQLTGSVTAPQMATLSPSVEGHVQQILFRNGQSVQKGFVLIRLNDATEVASLNEAKAKLMASKAKYQRFQHYQQEAGNTPYFAPYEVADQKSTFLQDKAAVDFAQAALDKRRIAAPFDGVAGEKKVSVGDYVGPGTALVNLVSYKKLQVSFKLPETDAGKVHLGQQVELQTPANPGTVFYATISFIAPAADVETRTLTCLADIQKAKALLRPGMFVQVLTTLGHAQKALQVPEEALVPDYPGYVVYMVKNNKAVKTKVMVGKRKNNMAAITTGLKYGDKVVVRGQSNLSNGQTVKVVSN